PGAGDNLIMNVLSGIMAAACAVSCVTRLALQPTREATRIWVVLSALLAILAVHESLEVAGGTAAQLNDIVSIVILTGSILVAVLLRRFDTVPRLAANVFRFGFVFQLSSTTAATVDKLLTSRFGIDSGTLQLLIDYTQLVGIQLYFAASILFLLSLN